ncbi:tyrosine recombinase XerD-like protein [Thermoanaerobacter kivui]|uniref:Tyrosine recombinase XerD-like protein n=1 Tax=Thermoanaerobacter kivui TaxID=2325 RepID=A0A097ARG9_THEKI|nr:site-specific tyrosine recombinase [Thermoanaerobacter kivui]AIS52405.1 tyrosine recombinase XerD-like protein [Thermoanaerobacter kivui]
MLNDIVGEFLDFLKKQKRLSKNTLESYSRDINQFFKYLNNSHINYLHVKKSIILNYLYYLKKNGKSQATISRSLSSLKAFYHYLFMKKLIEEDPTYMIDTPKVEKRVPATLTVEQVDMLLSLDFGNDEKGLRDKALIELLYATGLKVSEVISLKLEDVNLSYGYIVTRSGKERVIPIGSHAIAALKDYIEKGRKGNPEEKTLFLNLRGKKLTRQGCWKIIREYTDKINPGFPVTPNTLRQSFAQHMLENGADVRAVQEMLGYQTDFNANLISLMSKSKIKEVYNKFHPRA